MRDTLILGSYGRMGIRYAQILRYLGIEHDGWDVKEIGDTHTSNTGRQCPNLHDYSRVIICTPTERHVDNIIQCIKCGVKYILCEKPVAMSTKSIDELCLVATQSLSDIRVVCNWAYVFDRSFRPEILKVRCHDVYYRNWYSGQHSRDWNCIQLHYLSRDRADLGDGPVLDCRIDDRKVTLDDIDLSYVMMLRQWYRNTEALWGLADIIEQTRLIESYQG